MHVPWHRLRVSELVCDAGGKGIAVSALRSDADFIAVMRFPELVLRYDWPALARETGVYTNEKHLRDLVKRCFEKSLTVAALKERGLQQLLARLRATDGGTAPRALLPLATAPSMATAPSTDLGVGGAAAVYQWGGRRKAGRDSSRSRRSGIA